MAQDKADYRYTVVLLEGAILPHFSENTDKETVQVINAQCSFITCYFVTFIYFSLQKSLFQFGYHSGLTNIESVTVVKDNLKSGAVYKLYGGEELLVSLCCV